MWLWGGERKAQPKRRYYSARVGELGTQRQEMGGGLTDPSAGRNVGESEWPAAKVGGWTGDAQAATMLRGQRRGEPRLRGAQRERSDAGALRRGLAGGGLFRPQGCHQSALRSGPRAAKQTQPLGPNSHCWLRPQAGRTGGLRFAALIRLVHLRAS